LMLFLFMIVFLDLTQIIFNTFVDDNDHNTTETTEDLREEALVHTGQTFLLHDLSGAVDTVLVQAVSGGLLGLQHETTTNGIEGVVEGEDSGTGSSGDDDSGSETDETLVLGVGVQTHDGSIQTELTSTVNEGTSNGDSGTTVQTLETLLLDGLGEAVPDTVELTLTGLQVRGQTGTGEIHRVAHNHSGSTTQTTSHKIVQEEHGELLVLVLLGEDGLEKVVEGEGGTLLGGITQAVHEVTTPESSNTLLGGDTPEAVANTSVRLDLARDDLGVGVHGLHQNFDTLHRGHDGLGDGSDDTSQEEITDELVSLLIRHGGLG